MVFLKKILFIKKKLFMLVIICVYYCLLQEVKDNLLNYIRFYDLYCYASDHTKHSNDEKQKFVVVDNFFERLVNQLFYEKQDSALVKEILLLCRGDYSDFCGCLYLGYYGEYYKERKKVMFENDVVLHLNMYRLGFLGYRGSIRIRSDF